VLSLQERSTWRPAGYSRFRLQSEVLYWGLGTEMALKLGLQQFRSSHGVDGGNRFTLQLKATSRNSGSMARKCTIMTRPASACHSSFRISSRSGGLEILRHHGYSGHGCVWGHAARLQKTLQTRIRCPGREFRHAPGSPWQWLGCGALFGYGTSALGLLEMAPDLDLIAVAEELLSLAHHL